MRRAKTVFVIATCALCLSSAKAALQLDWQNETQPTGLPGGISVSPDVITHPVESDGVSALDAGSALAAGSVSPGVSMPGIAFDSFGTKDSNGGDRFTASSDIRFTAAGITPVPEPTNYALACFGLAFVFGGAGRFCLRRRANAEERM